MLPPRLASARLAVILLPLLSAALPTSAQVPVGKAVGVAVAMGPRQQTRSAAAVKSGMAEVDASIANYAMFKAIKKADPAEYQRFRTLMRKALESGKSTQEIMGISSQFGNTFLQTRLRHASPATIKKYLTLRTEYLEQLSAVSPTALYSLLNTGSFDLAGQSLDSRKKIEAITQRLSDKMVPIIVAPSSPNPIPQNAALARKNSNKVRRALSPREAAELNKEHFAGNDPALFCQAVVHLYREGLRLPDVQAVQLFRLMKVISEDDRGK